MDGGFDLAVLVLEVDDFGVREEHQPIGGQGAGEEILGFLVELLEQLFGLLGRIAQAHGLEGAPGGGEAFGLQENVLEQVLIGLGQVPLVFGQHGGIEALAGAGAFKGHRGSADVHGARRGITIGAIFRMVLQIELAFLKQGRGEQLSQTCLEQLGQLLR